MSPRERNLAMIVGAMVALWGASIGWNKYQTALERNSNEQINAAQELSTAKTAALRGRRAQGKIRKWNKQSLPTDADFAKSLYQDWLRQQLTAAGLTVKSLTATTPRSQSKSYREYNFAVSATGQLSQLSEFLYKFYQAKHLHRISATTLTPTEAGKGLTISLDVDAIALPKADREDLLAEGTVEALQQPFEAFKDSIEPRNLFAKYEPPRPPVAEASRPPETQGDDEAAQAIFSGIHYGDDGWLMLVRMRESGKLLYFREGDEISIGRFQGTIEELDGDRRRAVVETGRRRVQVLFGKPLSEAYPLRERRAS